MEARTFALDSERIRAMLTQIRDSKGNDGKGLAGVEAATGVNRTTLSQFVNYGTMYDNRKLKVLADYLDAEYGLNDEDDASDTPKPQVNEGSRFGQNGYIQQTKDYSRVVNGLRVFQRRQTMCMVIGHSGTGKTTAVREFVRQSDNAYYVQCWPYMSARDLLESIARALGFSTGQRSVTGAAMRIVAELEERPGAMIVYDEAENLVGSNLKKLDTLRLICQNSPSGAAFVGTTLLTDTLTRGKFALAGTTPLVRRENLIRMNGVEESEVRDMLRGIDLEENVRREMIALGLDTKRGGLGNLAEILNLCVEVAQGGRITEDNFRGAKKYKLLY